MGVVEARVALATAYGMADRQMADKPWAVGEDFCIADRSAAPALFYAAIVAPFPPKHENLEAYFERLVTRSSVKRTLEEAQPHFGMFPYGENIPPRFLSEV